MFLFIRQLEGEWSGWRAYLHSEDQGTELAAHNRAILLLLSFFFCLFFPFIQTLFEGAFALTQ